MKKIRMIVSATVVFAVVGSALAFKTVSNPDLLVCDTQKNICVQPSTPYSTTGITPLNPRPTVYKGIAGEECDTPECPKYDITKPVFINI
jgi:hypothetical protein